MFGAGVLWQMLQLMWLTSLNYYLWLALMVGAVASMAAHSMAAEMVANVDYDMDPM